MAYRGLHMERQRVTVQEAAKRLGVKEPAIRKRIKRGTLQSYREGGRVYVFLDTERSAGQSTGYSEERSEERHQERDELVEELRRQNEYLREESRRKDHIIAGLVERLPPAIEPPEPQSAPTEAGSRSDRGTAPQEPEEATERPRRGFLRRIFGG